MTEIEPFTESNHPALFYESMLADDVRMRRYRQAINQAVKPGDVVADLGTGTGILALLAIKAGASRVYAIDNRPRSIMIAERIIRANDAVDKVRLVEADVREVKLEEPVDVVVNELIGDFGTDENIFECVRAFARNNLKPGGSIIPSRLRTFLVPVEYHNEFRGIWRRNWHGVDLRAAVEFPRRPEPVMYGLRNRPKELADAFVLEDIRFSAEMGRRELNIDCRFLIKNFGVLQGFVGYFDAVLGKGQRIGNYPCRPPCHWQNWNWPVLPSIPVEPGQVINAVLKARENMVAAGWTMEWDFLR